MTAPSLASSLDGQWTAIRRGRDVSLFDQASSSIVATITLDVDATEVLLLGPPILLATVARHETSRVTLYQPPQLETVARLELDQPMRVVAVSGPRIALLSLDQKHVTIARVASKAIATQSIDPGSQVEFVVGLERNQLLLGLARKLEVWDAVSCRPLLRLQLQLPPPPRLVGAAQGHLWVTRPGTDEVYVYRLSDGRPFRHQVGATVQDVICHPASPIVVLVTPRGLVRLHCFAHSLTVVDTPWTPGSPLALQAFGDEVGLIGLSPDADAPWRAPLTGNAAAIGANEPGKPGEPAFHAASNPDATAAPAATERSPPAPAMPAPEPSGQAPTAPEPVVSILRPEPAPAIALAQPAGPAPSNVAYPRGWRDAFARAGLALVRGDAAPLPDPAEDSELAVLANQLGLSTPARAALCALYAMYLHGDAGPSIARLAQVLGDWTEPLGQGDLGALAMLRRREGRVALRSAVADLLDGSPPRAIRLVGDTPSTPRHGAFRIPRDGKSDAELEAELARVLGRIAVLEGDPDRGILEARLHGATAIAFAPPDHRPRPWPRDAGLVLVLYGSPTSWVADLPALPPDVTGA